MIEGVPLKKQKLVQNRNEKNSAKIFMKQEVIDKLPPDAKKQFLKYAIKLSEKKKQSKVKVLQNKVTALTNVIRKLIEEINDLKSLSQGTLTAYQLHIGKDEWEKLVEELYDKEKRNVGQQLEERD